MTERSLPINNSVCESWIFDHIGVVVADLAKGRAHFVAMLGVSFWTEPLTDPTNGVHLTFGRDPTGVVYELLAPINATSPVYSAMRARTNILNHTAYRVPDLEAAAAHLRDARCAPTGHPSPAIAFGGARIQFFVTPIASIIEIIEAPLFEHAFQLEVR